jgi:hypothetical protein
MLCLKAYPSFDKRVFTLRVGDFDIRFLRFDSAGEFGVSNARFRFAQPFFCAGP